MYTQILGENIAKLRKDKGITQEALAASVGVSGQAVSKWEGGGSPDIELLPVIADFFAVSVDQLFGRDVLAHTDIRTEFYKTLAPRAGADEATTDVIIKQLCINAWEMNKAAFGVKDADNDMAQYDISIDEAGAKAGTDRYTVQSVIDAEGGLSHIKLNADKRYFLLMPKPEGGWKFDEAKLSALFADLANPEFFRALMYLHKNHGPVEMFRFTLKHFAEKLGVDEAQATELVKKLQSYGVLYEEKILVDDSELSVYVPQPNATLIPFLALAEDIIKPANVFLFAYHGFAKTWLAKE
ncbi:MAG: helix-turn-helix domain-containing protein [Oscillospiraceae bacterium]|nr:helix-turn-helix domain-containing protein [Oscillospiraceae bacterium]